MRVLPSCTCSSTCSCWESMLFHACARSMLLQTPDFMDLCRAQHISCGRRSMILVSFDHFALACASPSKWAATMSSIALHRLVSGCTCCSQQSCRHMLVPRRMHTKLHRVLTQVISVIHHCCSNLRGGTGVLPIDRLTDVRSPVEVVAQRIPRALLEKACGLRLPSPAMHEPQDRWVSALPGLADMTDVAVAVASITKGVSLYGYILHQHHQTVHQTAPATLWCSTDTRFRAGSTPVAHLLVHSTSIASSRSSSSTLRPLKQ